MTKISGDFHDFDLQKAQLLAQSSAAQQLFALLQHTDQAALRSAMTLAAAGDLNGARQILEKMTATPQAQALLQQLQGDRNG